MGAYSGYDRVCQTMQAKRSVQQFNVWRNGLQKRSNISNRLLSWAGRGAQSSPFYNPASTAAELAVLWQSQQRRSTLVHITYIENQLGILPNFKQKFSLKLIGTCHQPSSWWRLMHPYPSSLSSLDALVVLSRKEISYFEDLSGTNNVHFIPHGIDTYFFQPAEPLRRFPTKAPRCVFCGTWLRDLDTLDRVIDLVLTRNPGVQFDIILPRSKRKQPVLYRIARHPQVKWHADLSDDELVCIYQQANLLLLPLLDCTANNAVLEAMACGLPIVSNNVGGLSDYTDPSFASLLPVGDVDSMAEEVLKLVDTASDRQIRGAKARQYAVENFQWNRIAEQTFALYSSTTNS